MFLISGTRMSWEREEGLSSRRMTGRWEGLAAATNPSSVSFFFENSALY
jgi:hypothetical protein